MDSRRMWKNAHLAGKNARTAKKDASFHLECLAAIELRDEKDSGPALKKLSKKADKETSGAVQAEIDASAVGSKLFKKKKKITEETGGGDVAVISEVVRRSRKRNILAADDNEITEEGSKKKRRKLKGRSEEAWASVLDEVPATQTKKQIKDRSDTQTKEPVQGSAESENEVDPVENPRKKKFEENANKSTRGKTMEPSCDVEPAENSGKKNKAKKSKAKTEAVSKGESEILNSKAKKNEGAGEKIPMTEAPGDCKAAECEDQNEHVKTRKKQKKTSPDFDVYQQRAEDESEAAKNLRKKRQRRAGNADNQEEKTNEIGRGNAQVTQKKQKKGRSKVEPGESAGVVLDAPEKLSDDEESETRVAEFRKRRSSKGARILDSSEEEGVAQVMEIKEEREEEEKKQRRSARGKDGAGRAKMKIKRCVSSSDEDEPSVTPSQKRRQMLAAMAAKKRKSGSRRGRLNFSESSDAEMEGSEQSDDSDASCSLPMFENEEFPPESESEEKPKVSRVRAESEESGGDDSFIAADDSDEEAGCDSEDGKGENIPEDEERSEEDEECEDDDDDNDAAEEEEDGVHVNPYLQINRELDSANIFDILAKNTDKDRQNKKRYKKEVGKYQFQIHSENNQALCVSNTTRYQRNMAAVKFDKGFKEVRNLDVKDEEYYEYCETCLLGERVQIFPHTRRTAKFASKCSLFGCQETFEVGGTKLVGVKKFDEYRGKFTKKRNKFDKEAFYYICYRHCPSEEVDNGSSDYSSYSDDDE